jgi:hypothetical protein
MGQGMVQVVQYMYMSSKLEALSLNSVPLEKKKKEKVFPCICYCVKDYTVFSLLGRGTTDCHPAQHIYPQEGKDQEKALV